MTPAVAKSGVANRIWQTMAAYSCNAISKYKLSLAASPSPPGRSGAHARRSRAEGGEGLANFAVD